VQVATDAAASGASTHGRPGLDRLLADLDSFDVLVVYDASRLSRDEADFAKIRKDFEYHDKKIFSASTGDDFHALSGRILNVVAAH
jgi:DNA invertase Pin-like site-specific DNA recombinase